MSGLNVHVVAGFMKIAQMKILKERKDFVTIALTFYTSPHYMSLYVLSLLYYIHCLYNYVHFLGVVEQS